jgi:hypothetical protein
MPPATPRRARSFDIVGDYGFHAGARGVFAVILLASAPKGNRAGPVGIGVHHRLYRDNAHHRLSRRHCRFLVNHCRQRTAGNRLWDPVVRCAKVRQQKRLDSPRIDGGRSLAHCLLIGPIYQRPEAHATVVAAIGVAYTLLVVFELWRGRGDQVWHWPIIVLLLAHGAAIPIHLPLAGALSHPDPSDPSNLDLLTFAVFESAFVCISTAYLFDGLAKDRNCRKLPTSLTNRSSD